MSQHRTKLQEVYRSHQTRHMLADSAVVAEELWRNQTIRTMLLEKTSGKVHSITEEKCCTGTLKGVPKPSSSMADDELLQRPPRLEDAGLEDCALPPESIARAFSLAAGARLSLSVDADGDGLSPRADETAVVGGGGVGAAADQAVIGGGGDEKDKVLVVGDEEKEKNEKKK